MTLTSRRNPDPRRATQTAEGPRFTAIVYVVRVHIRPCTLGGTVESNHRQPLETQVTTEVSS